MTDRAESSSSANGKRKLYVACNACRFRKVKCDREPRLEQGYSTCSNCEASTMECVLTVNPPKKRMGKRMKLLQEQQEANESASIGVSSQGFQAPVATSLSASNSADNSFANTSVMSPGLRSLLQAVSDQEATHLNGVNTSNAAAGVTSGVEDLTPLLDQADSNSSIIQNSMFAAFGSDFSTGNAPVIQTRRTSLEGSASSSSPKGADVTPKSVNGSSDQSSPEIIASNAAFINSNAAFINSNAADAPIARQNTLKRRNPFDKTSANGSKTQVGFVGGLLGIASLDKHMLDICVKSYFDSMGQCIGFIRPEWFWPRYNSFFSRYSGLFLDPQTHSNEEPLSELLLIAVACRGASASRFANRFELQTDLFQHYCRLIKDRERLVRDGFDALESVVLMVEVAFAAPQGPADAMSVKGLYDVDVLSHEGLIRLMKKLQLHLEKPFGTRLEGRDAIRQRILFWTIYVFDAIRSEAGRTLPLIDENEISLTRTLPAHVPHPERVVFRLYFIELAGICRTVATKIQSPRVQGSGIDPQDVIDVLDALQAWHDRLGPLFAWDWNDMLHITGPTDPEDQTRRTFLIFLFTGQWITLEYAIEEIGFAPNCDPMLKEQLTRRLEREVDVTLDRQVLVCDHGTLFGIIRLHPLMMQSWAITWANWCLKRMQNIIAKESEGRLASAKADQAFQRYQSAILCFINATASCDSADHTPTTVQDLMDALRKVTEARKSARLTFDSL